MKIQRIVRRIHFFIALSLTPWVILYAVTGFTMNHRERMREIFKKWQPTFETEREFTYNGIFPDVAAPRVKALQILSDIELEGTFGVNEKRNNGILTIWRSDPLEPRCITFKPSNGSILVEREYVYFPYFIERMHRRRGNWHGI